MQDQTAQLQNEIIRLKAELYDVRSATESRISMLQQAIVAIAQAADIHPNENGDFNLKAVVDSVAEKLSEVQTPEGEAEPVDTEGLESKPDSM